MRAGLVIGLGTLILFAAVAPAGAQTRLSLEGGVVVPLGAFGDLTDASLRYGIRAEIQPVNAIGERRLLAWFARVGFADLSFDSEVERTLYPDGLAHEPYLLDVGGGARVYSRVAPFFVSAGAGWVRYRPGGVGSSARSGVDLYGGLGFSAPVASVHVEAELALHEALLGGDSVSGGDDLQYVTGLLGLALPF